MFGAVAVEAGGELSTTVAASPFETTARTRVTSSSSSSIDGVSAATTPCALLIGCGETVECASSPPQLEQKRAASAFVVLQVEQIISLDLREISRLRKLSCRRGSYLQIIQASNSAIETNPPIRRLPPVDSLPLVISRFHPNKGANGPWWLMMFVNCEYGIDAT